MTYGFQGRCFFNPNGGKVVVYVGAELRKAQPIINVTIAIPESVRETLTELVHATGFPLSRE
jgi:hypothetical protein